MCAYDFDEMIDRRGSNCFKWDMASKIFNHGDLLPMWVADMEFASPAAVRDAITSRAAHPVYGYGARPDSYFQSYIDWAEKRYDFGVKKEWLLFSPGIVPALSIAVIAYTAPGDGVMIQPPVYPPFAGVIRDNGRRVVENELAYKNGRYEIDFDDFEKKAKGGVKLFLLCSPHNPVGRAWKREELERMASICYKNGITIVSDEIHADIVYGGYKHICTASLSEKIREITVTLQSPSKTFNITGLSISTAVISNEDLRRALKSHIERFHIELTNIFGIVAFEAAYRHGESWLVDLLKYLEANRDMAAGFISRELPRIKPINPEATFLMWLDFTGYKLPQKELVETIIKKGNLGLNDGVTFGAGGEGFMRLNFACPKKMLEDGLMRLKTAFHRV